MAKVSIIPGPLTSKVSKEDAEDKLTNNPRFPKDSSYTLDEVEGRWVAAIVEADGPPPPPLDTPEDFASLDDTPEETPEKPKDEKEDKDKDKSIEDKVEHLTDLLTKVVDALGLGDKPEKPAEDAPPSPDSPEDDAHHKDHLIHERALKPGEAPPGTTPVGAPAFSNVREDHPWKNVAGQAATFTVEDEVGNTPLSEVQGELKALASEIGYTVKQVRHSEDNGTYKVAALISKY